LAAPHHFDSDTDDDDDEDAFMQQSGDTAITTTSTTNSVKRALSKAMTLTVKRTQGSTERNAPLGISKER
jgi:hypothetical protein